MALKRKRSTYATYRLAIRNHVLPAAGSLRLDRVDSRAIEALYAHLRETGVGDATCHKVHLPLHRAFTSAVRKRIVAMDPFDGVGPPRYRAKEMQSLSPRQAKKFLGAVRSNRYEAL